MQRNSKFNQSTRIFLSVFLLSGMGIASAFPFGNNAAKASHQYPAQVVDLSNWKQTLPTGSSKKPQEIKVDKLGTYSNAPFFQVASSGQAIQFRAPVNGVTTSGSGYPRSELREMKNGGKDLADWSTTSGAHVMYVDQAITAVPKKKKHVVAGQIHDSEDDVIVIRLEYPKLFVDINGEQGPVLDPKYELGKRFNVKFVAEGGKIKIFYNGNSAPAHTISKKGTGYYFKAGAYTQSNCSKESDCSGGNYGEVMIYDLWVKHAKSLAEIAIPAAKASEEKIVSAPAEEVVLAKVETPETSENVIVPTAIAAEEKVIEDDGLSLDNEELIQEEKSILSRIFLAIASPFRGLFEMMVRMGNIS